MITAATLKREEYESMHMMKNIGRFGAMSVLSALIFALGPGCALMSEAPDPASGRWEGHWYLGKATQPAGVLNADITSTGRDSWNAVFYAEFGGAATYEVRLPGHRDGERVVFEGEIDLGAASGGVFTWSGGIDGDVFSGVYTSRLPSGTFKLERAEAAPQ